MMMEDLNRLGGVRVGFSLAPGWSLMRCCGRWERFLSRRRDIRFRMVSRERSDAEVPSSNAIYWRKPQKLAVALVVTSALVGLVSVSGSVAKHVAVVECCGMSMALVGGFAVGRWGIRPEIETGWEPTGVLPTWQTRRASLRRGQKRPSGVQNAEAFQEWSRNDPTIPFPSSLEDKSWCAFSRREWEDI
eukprot:CAMPEP_0184687132 /NCGR_PEP_ID=MMETSP0312-20130426/25237_1 /TAXON_ID=31354 /ORGANISM="Compsopogon coeruleus, Strain SAG 36.94" /LENGTH=188 /DNA_ID=CAMNT_0027142919 /DNA_START=78 /DNA_END=644 /DNA_ORIENTATION=-